MSDATKPVYSINPDMPWSEVFRVTWKFAVAAFAIWVVLSIPLAILGGVLGSWNKSREQAAQQEHNSRVERLLMGD